MISTRDAISDNVLSLRELRRLLDTHAVAIFDAGLTERATSARFDLETVQEMNMRASMADYAGREAKARRALREVDRRMSNLSYDVLDICDHARRADRRNRALITA